VPRWPVVTLAAFAAALMSATPAAGAPSDALVDEQWAVSPDAVFGLPGAWELSQGAGVVVAVVDSGARLEHPDLAPNIWTNFDEVPGNGVDDDNNGYVDDVHGVDLTTTSPSQNLNDGFGHGTHVAGTIAAAANGRGVVGVAYRARLMIVRVLADNGGGTTGAVAEGIRYAAANGARIINLSLESRTDDPRVRDAIAEAAAANALVVASAGNSGYDVDSTPTFPVSIPAPNLVGVAATAPNTGKSLPSFSNYGRLTVPVGAPGSEVISTSIEGSGYEYKSGTSMAAPHVAGVAALMASVAPQLTAAELRALLLQHAVRTNAPIGNGMVDALASVLAATGNSSYDRSQPPRARILSATRAGKGRKAVTKARIALLGSRQAVARVTLSLDGRRVASLRARREILSVKLKRRTGRKLTARAVAADGRTLAKATARVRALRPGKRGVRRGGGIGGNVWVG
jgi:subtilisin family serine protease